MARKRTDTTMKVISVFEGEQAAQDVLRIHLKPIILKTRFPNCETCLDWRGEQYGILF